MRASVACDGQVSDNPKHLLPLTTVGFPASDLSVATLLASCDEGTKRSAEATILPSIPPTPQPTHSGIIPQPHRCEDQHDARDL